MSMQLKFIMKCYNLNKRTAEERHPMCNPMFDSIKISNLTPQQTASKFDKKA